MRRFIVFIFALAALSLVAGQASALTYTVEQIKGVCGKNYLEGGPGHAGCTHKCGTKICNYDCDTKTGKCTGEALRQTRPPGRPNPDSGYRR
jgi:hypothetical protein